jgi:hypothetical protein
LDIRLNNKNNVVQCFLFVRIEVEARNYLLIRGHNLFSTSAAATPTGGPEWHAPMIKFTSPNALDDPAEFAQNRIKRLFALCRLDLPAPHIHRLPSRSMPANSVALQIDYGKQPKLPIISTKFQSMISVAPPVLWIPADNIQKDTTPDNAYIVADETHTLVKNVAGKLWVEINTGNLPLSMEAAEHFITAYGANLFRPKARENFEPRFIEIVSYPAPGMIITKTPASHSRCIRSQFYPS